MSSTACPQRATLKSGEEDKREPIDSLEVFEVTCRRYWAILAV